MSQNVQNLYQTFGLDQFYHLDLPPTLPPLDTLNTGSGPPLTIEANTRIIWLANIATAWIPPDPLPQLPFRQGHQFTPGRPYAPPRRPIPGNSANPVQNISAYGAAPVYIVPNNAVGAIIPMVGAANQIAIGGTAVALVIGPCNGGYCTNPANAAAQGIATAENLYIDMVNPPGATDATAYGSTVLLTPGQNFTIPAIGAGVIVWGCAATSGHNVTVVVW
jgi:hypothetical protein